MSCTRYSLGHRVVHHDEGAGAVRVGPEVEGALRGAAYTPGWRPQETVNSAHDNHEQYSRITKCEYNSLIRITHGVYWRLLTVP